MDPLSSIAISAIASAAGYGMLHSIKYMNKLTAVRMVGLNIPYGKSTLTSNMNRNNENKLFIDLDEYLCDLDKVKYEELSKGDSTKFLVHYMKAVLEHLMMLLKNFPKKKIIVVSANIDLLKEIGLDTRVFLPSEKFITLQNLNEDIKKHISNKKLEMLMKHSKINVYDSYQQLNEKIRKKYKLKDVLNI